MSTTKFDPETLARLEADVTAARKALHEVDAPGSYIILPATNGLPETKTFNVSHPRVQELDQEFDACASRLNAALEAKFEAEWPYRFDLQSSGSWPEIEADLRTVLCSPGFQTKNFRLDAALPELGEWLDEHVGGDGYAMNGFSAIGIRDPDAAFWFKCRWM